MNSIDKSVLLYIKEHAEECENNPWNILFNYALSYYSENGGGYDFGPFTFYKDLIKFIPEEFPDIVHEKESGDLQDFEIDINKLPKVFPNWRGDFLSDDRPSGDSYLGMYDFLQWYDFGYSDFFDTTAADECVALYRCMKYPPSSVNAILIIFWCWYLGGWDSSFGDIKEEFNKSKEALERIVNE